MQFTNDIPIVLSCVLLVRFKNEEYTLYLACVGASTLKNEQYTFANGTPIVLVYVWLARFKNEEYALYFSCVCARIYILYLFSAFWAPTLYANTNGIPIGCLLFNW